MSSFIDEEIELEADELELVAELYCRENLNLLVAIEREPKLRDWLADFSEDKSEEYSGIYATLCEEVRDRAYQDGLIFDAYVDVLEDSDVDPEDVCDLSPMEIEDMSKLEIIACIAYIIDGGKYDEAAADSVAFFKAVGDGALVNFFESYIEKCEEELEEEY